MKPFQVRYQPFLRFAFEQSQNSIPLRSLCNLFLFHVYNSRPTGVMSYVNVRVALYVLLRLVDMHHRAEQTVSRSWKSECM